MIKTIIVILSLISAISFGLAIYSIFMNTNKFSNKIKHNKTIIVSLILLAISLVIICYTIDYIVDIYQEPHEFKKDFKDIGPYGDFFGGILNPIFAFVGIIAASLAFYSQYQANKQVQDQFKIQQFESQFYERLNLIREEISNSYLPMSDKTTLKGRQVFYELDKEIRLIYFLVNNLVSTDDVKVKFEITYYIFYKGRIKYFNSINHFQQKYNLNRNELLEVELFLSSIYEYLKTNRDSNIGFRAEVVLDNLYDVINLGGKLNDFLDVDYNYHYSYLLLKYNDNININHLPFKGMETKMSLVLRQIYSLVKFVTSENMSYESKRNYLRVLRSILSNYEQLHIFYNWYSGTGSAWEGNKNKFLTDYRMIHNIPFDFVIEDIDLLKVFSGINYKKEKGRLDDCLFEYEDQL